MLLCCDEHGENVKVIYEEYGADGLAMRCPYCLAVEIIKELDLEED